MEHCNKDHGPELKEYLDANYKPGDSLFMIQSIDVIREGALSMSYDELQQISSTLKLISLLPEDERVAVMAKLAKGGSSERS